MTIYSLQFRFSSPFLPMKYRHCTFSTKSTQGLKGSSLIRCIPYQHTYPLSPRPTRSTFSVHTRRVGPPCLRATRPAHRSGSSSCCKRPSSAASAASSGSATAQRRPGPRPELRTRWARATNGTAGHDYEFHPRPCCGVEWVERSFSRRGLRAGVAVLSVFTKTTLTHKLPGDENEFGCSRVVGHSSTLSWWVLDTGTAVGKTMGVVK